MERREPELLRRSQCANCGATFSPDAPEGCCVACLLQLGCEPVDEEDDEFVEPAGEVESREPSAHLPWPRLANYQILRELGEGGSAVVYAARQLQPVRREVALKVIKPGMSTRGMIARFASEKQALAVMDHPNIARVFDAGTTGEGSAYFVMEQVAGVPITAFCDRKKTTVRERIALFIEVCNAVQHAHQKGIIHRDLKPANVLVTEHDGRPAPKVIDFGIAKATGGLRLSERTIFTAFEPAIGTPAYMSPEQADLGCTDIDTRSDIWSLGVMLFELLTGRTPFDSLAQLGFDELRRKIREEQPLRPSARLRALPTAELETVAADRAAEPGRLIRSVGGDLDWIVMKALEKDRSRRYASAAGLALDLRLHLNAEPVTARPPSALYQLQKLARRHRNAFVAAAFTGVAIIAAAVISLWQAVVARQAEERALTEARKSRQVAQMLANMFQGVQPSSARGADTTLLREILDKAAARISGDLKDSPDVEAHLRRIIGWSYHKIGEGPKAEAQLRESVRLYRSIPGRELELCSALNWLTYVVRQRDSTEAETLGREALALMLQQSRSNHRRRDRREATGLAEHTPALATVLTFRNNADTIDEVLPMLREWLEFQKSVLGDTNSSVANTIGTLASLEQTKKNYAQAETYCRQALKLRRQLHGDDSLEVAHSLFRLSAVLMRRGQLEEADALIRPALATMRKFLGAEHPDLIHPLMHMGKLQTQRGNLDEAEAALREALAFHPKTSANRLSDLLKHSRLLANALAARGLPERADALRQDFAFLADRKR